MGELQENLAQKLLEKACDLISSNFEIAFPQMTLWKLARFTDSCIKASEILHRRGIMNCTEARQISAKFGFIYIAQASVEDDPMLQELMAGLLANAMDPNFDKEKLRLAYLDILKSLDPCDAQILAYCYKKKLPGVMTKDDVTKALNISEDTYDCSLENLKRLLLVRVPTRYCDLAISEETYAANDNSQFQLTRYCQNFLQACAL